MAEFFTLLNLQDIARHAVFFYSSAKNLEFFGTSQPLLVDQCLILMDGQILKLHHFCMKNSPSESTGVGNPPMPRPLLAWHRVAAIA